MKQQLADEHALLSIAIANQQSTGAHVVPLYDLAEALGWGYERAFQTLGRLHNAGLVVAGPEGDRLSVVIGTATVIDR